MLCCGDGAICFLRPKFGAAVSGSPRPGTSGRPSRRSCPVICHIPLPDNSRQEASTARASTADQDRIGLEPGFKALNLLDVIKLASPAAKDGALRRADTLGQNTSRRLTVELDLRRPIVGDTTRPARQ